MVHALRELRIAWEAWILSGIASIELHQRLRLQQLIEGLNVPALGMTSVCIGALEALRTHEPAKVLLTLVELQRRDHLLIPLAPCYEALLALAPTTIERPTTLHREPSSELPLARTQSAEHWITMLNARVESEAQEAARWLSQQEPRWLAVVLPTLSETQRSLLAGVFVARDETERWLFAEIEAFVALTGPDAEDESTAKILVKCMLSWSQRMDVEATRVTQLADTVQQVLARREGVVTSESARALNAFCAGAVRALIALEYAECWALVPSHDAWGELTRAEWTVLLQSAMRVDRSSAKAWLARQLARESVQSWELEFVERKKPARKLSFD